MLKPVDWGFIIFIAIGISGLMIMPLVSDSPLLLTYYSLTIQSVTALLAGIFCISAGFAHSSGGTRRAAWLFLGGGAFFWFVGNMVYTLYMIMNNGTEPPHPYFSDIGFIAFVILSTISLLVIITTLKIHPPLWGYVIAGLVFIGAVSAYFYMGMMKDDGIVLIISILYSILPPLTAVAAILLCSCLIKRSKSNRAWFTVSVGLILYFTSHFLFIYEMMQGHYQTGNSFVDILVSVAFLLIIAAGMMGENKRVNKVQ